MSLWKRPDRAVVLASASPRRKEILERLGIGFEVVVPQISNESQYLDPADISGSLALLAEAKARSVSCDYPQSLVLGADTIVVHKGHILGKPRDRAEAQGMIEALSGGMHTVFTACALVCEECQWALGYVGKTLVQFRDLCSSEIGDYLDCAHYLDKAGAYGIQDTALCLIEKIDGCFYNVVGLPASGVIHLLSGYVHRKDAPHVRST